MNLPDSSNEVREAVRSKLDALRDRLEHSGDLIALDEVEEALAQQDQESIGVEGAAIDAAERARVLMEAGEEEKAHAVLEKLKWQREARCTVCGGPLEGAEGPECDSVGCPGREDGEAN